MTKDVLIMSLGAWVAIMPFLGFPGSWDKALLIITGIIIISIGIIIRRNKPRQSQNKRTIPLFKANETNNTNNMEGISNVSAHDEEK